MNEKPGKEKAGRGPRKRVLGQVPEGEFDTSLEPAPESELEAQSRPPERVEGLGGLRKKESGRSGDKPASAVERAAKRKYTAPHAPEGDDRLTLPGGGLVAMRRSGGIRFTSRSVVVYRDGRVSAEGDPAIRGRNAKETRRLSDEELAELYRALEGADLATLPPATGRQSPDAYAYEIAARVGGDDYSIEVFDGSIPGQLAPLVRLLTRYMRSPE